MASMRPRTRKDGSVFWEVLFRHDGRQRSLSFETAEHGQRFRDLVDLIGPAKALEAYPSFSSMRFTRPGRRASSPTMV